jgi:hypothetical protein
MKTRKLTALSMTLVAGLMIAASSAGAQPRHDYDDGPQYTHDHHPGAMVVQPHAARYAYAPALAYSISPAVYAPVPEYYDPTPVIYAPVGAISGALAGAAIAGSLI